MASQVEVAEYLNLTDRQLRTLQKLPGAPLSKGRGNLDKDAWRLFYISYLRNNKRDVSDPDSEDQEHRLLIARAELTEQQAISQRLKNNITERRLVDVTFCSFAMSRLAGELASVLDSLPLAMQRKFPDITDRQLAYLKLLVAKGANRCTETADKIPDFLDEYITTTAAEDD